LPDVIENNFNEPILYIIDDLMSEASKSYDMLNSFIRKSHHQLISIIFLMQNFFFKNCRDLTMNCKYACLFKNPRETNIVSMIGRQMNAGKNFECLNLAYNDCCKMPYGYILIDFSQNQNDACRIRNSMFPEDCVVYANKSLMNE
jgi:hypothetical protein